MLWRSKIAEYIVFALATKFSQHRHHDGILTQVPEMPIRRDPSTQIDYSYCPLEEAQAEGVFGRNSTRLSIVPPTQDLVPIREEGQLPYADLAAVSVVVVAAAMAPCSLQADEAVVE